jgi:hypothetical protein
MLDGANRTTTIPLTNHGKLEMGGGLYHFVSGATVGNETTGTISGVGEIRSVHLTNGGTVSPGASAGLLYVNGHYQQESTGNLAIEIFGNDNSDIMNPEYDVLRTGTASLNGLLNVSLEDFTPGMSDVYTVFESDMRSGAFSNVANGQRITTEGLEGSFVVAYTGGGEVTLSNFALIADYNFDGTVNAADYTVWRNSLNQTGAGLAADGNRDEIVNHLDYVVWKAGYGISLGAGVASESTEAVPEPSALLLWLAALIISCARRARQK